MKNSLRVVEVALAVLLVVFLTACGGGGDDDGKHQVVGDASDNFSGEITAFAANNDSPYKDILADSVYFVTSKSSPVLSVLPLIGQEYDNPTIENVMDRVIITHNWMGNRFKELLQVLPDDLLQLMKSVTAIVIASDIRPAFYWSFTGAIYLDPQYLWLTYEEKMTINQKIDYRSGFAGELNYRTPWRYVKNNDYIYEGFDWDSTEYRTIEDTKYKFAELLYHELAHANDFFPPSMVSDISPNQTVYDASVSIKGNRISDIIKNIYPLNSDILRELAQVIYKGNTPTDEQISMTPEMIVEEFENDWANDDYNYYTQYEDLAMIFEEVMMYYHFGIERDFAITKVPEVENPTGSDYIVVWGQRNRIADSNVKNKAKLIVSYILPELDLSDYFNNLSAPIEMEAEKNWIENLYISSVPAPVKKLEPSEPSRVDLDKIKVNLFIPY